MSVQVSKYPDDYLDDKPYWVAELSNGEKIWQDDNRPGVNPPQAWLRLKEYMVETKAKIVKLYLQNRSHLEFPLPDNAPGYFFCKKLLASLTGTVKIHSYVLGHWDGRKIYLSEWQVPELLELSREIRMEAELDHKEWLIKHE
jgi:hypothetical protein